MKIKIVFLLFVISFCSISARAQIYKGSFLVGGSIGGSYNSGEISGPGFSEKFSYTQAVLNPKAGYFFHQQFAVGVMAEYLYDSHDFKTEEVLNDSSVSFLLAGPFIRYYLPNHIFVEASFGFGNSTINKRDTFTGMRGTAGVGYAIFINEKVAVEPMLSYVYESRKGKNDVDYTRGGVALSIGMQVYLYRNPRTIFKKSL